MSEVRTIPWETISGWFTKNEQQIRDVMKFEGLRGAVNEVLRLAPDQPEVDAQRLRADTAEAENKLLRHQLAACAKELRKASGWICREVEAGTTSATHWAIRLRTNADQVDAALNPNPEAESQSDYLDSCKAAERALSLENQRITPARFKCLACGEYHEGSGNLPCPKMTPYAEGQSQRKIDAIKDAGFLGRKL